MFKRAVLLSLLLGVAACDQASAPTGVEPAPAVEAAAAAAAVEPGQVSVAGNLLASEPVAGAWALVGDGAVTGVQFTSADGAETVTIGCHGGTGQAFLNWITSNVAQDADVLLYTAAKTETFAAKGTNDGDHLLSVEVDGGDPRLGALKAQQVKFALHGLGHSVVVPWDARIESQLTACAS